MKKTLVTIFNGFQVLGEIEENLVEDYIACNVEQGKQVLIGDSIEDIITQISVNLRLLPNPDIELNYRDNYNRCLERRRYREGE